MIIVIQCAAKKRADAGFLRTKDGRRVLFVGNPAAAPPSDEVVYARPDDLSDSGATWREALVEYNRHPNGNPLGLCRAVDLYANPAYSRIARTIGAGNTYILSAGWGLIGAPFLIPNYDITFSMVKPHERYKRRRCGDLYRDFRMLPDDTNDEIVFFGGKDYIPLFCELTKATFVKRTIFFNSKVQPEAPGCSLERFSTTTRTNWHYESLSAFLDDTPNELHSRQADDPSYIG